MKNYFYFQLQYEVTNNSYKKVTNQVKMGKNEMNYVFTLVSNIIQILLEVTTTYLQ